MTDLYWVEDLVLYDETVEEAVEKDIDEDQEGEVLNPGKLEDLEYCWCVDNGLQLRHIDDKGDVDKSVVSCAWKTSLDVDLIVENGGLIAGPSEVSVWEERTETFIL